MRSERPNIRAVRSLNRRGHPADRLRCSPESEALGRKGSDPQDTVPTLRVDRDLGADAALHPDGADLSAGLDPGNLRAEAEPKQSQEAPSCPTGAGQQRVKAQ